MKQDVRNKWGRASREVGNMLAHGFIAVAGVAVTFFAAYQHAANPAMFPSWLVTVPAISTGVSALFFLGYALKACRGTGRPSQRIRSLSPKR